MAVFRIDKKKDYTVMSNHHLRNKELSLKAKGLFSVILSLPDDWDYTIKGLAYICKEGADSIAVDCMYGKRFTPTLVDETTNESVLSFYNVIAEYENKIPVTEAVEIAATDTADLNKVTNTASDSTMYVNYYKTDSMDNTSYGLIKFDLGNINFSKIVSAKLAVYGNSIGKDRSGDIIISDIGTDWDNTAIFGNLEYSPSAEIAKINGQTSGVFPTGNYSAIDITEYLRKYTGNEIGIGMAANYASDVTLSGRNSENPPKLIIQPGKMITLTYTCDGAPCADMEVSIEAVGATEYQTTKHMTDENGKLVLYLAEGSYKAVTEKEIGVRNASENTFTVSADDVTQSYQVEKNNEEKPKPAENPTYTFGTEFNQIKEFNTSSLSETKIGDTGLKVSTNSSNYNNVAVMDAKTKTGTGYYPLGNTLPENGYYLFLGAGGNSNVSAALTFNNPVAAGKYIKITYAKPSVTNNGSANRTANNAHTITVGSEKIDIIDMGCENDKWYTTTVKASEEISKLDFTLGKWAGIAISKIEVTDSADTLEIIAEDDVIEKYITSDTQTVKYNAKVYNSITTEMDKTDIIAKGTADDTAQVTYSVNGYSGVSIDQNGSLSISPSASAGIVTVSAEYGGAKKSINLTLKALGSATAVEIYGDEVVKPGAAKYTAIPLADGVVIPSRDTKWEIVGEANGATVSADGTLTVPENAAEGVITIKATLTTSNIQSAEVSKEFNVTIRTNASKTSPYEVKGLLLKNGETDITKATGLDGVIIDKTDSANGDYAVTVKVFDSANKLIAEKSAPISVSNGVSKLDLDMTFTKASFAKVYVSENMGEADYPESDKDYEIVKVTKNVDKFAKAVVMQKADSETSARLIVAQYKNGALEKLEVKPTTLKKGQNEVDLSDVAYIKEETKVFLWDNLSSMKPLAEAVTEVSEGGVNLGMVVSDSIFKSSEGEYSNIPFVADWITGTKSGLGMGAGIIAPSGVPYGVDPDTVDVSALNVSYTYDDSYKGAETDNRGHQLSK